jgi:hypothetical protein
VVITPPSTYQQWQESGEKLGVEVECMSHAKFRMKTTKLTRTKPVIADEFHLFGGHGGQGWAKVDRLAMGLQAPMILCSATPNYNDAERVYCIQHVLDQHSCKGGYLQFLFAHCVLEANPFSETPNVLGFHHFKDAAEYLSSLPNVDYLPDDLVYTIVDLPFVWNEPAEFSTYGLNRRTKRIMASDIETRHARVNLSLIRDDGTMQRGPYLGLESRLFHSTGPMLVFANHSTVADAVARTIRDEFRSMKVAIVTGKTSPKKKQEVIDRFRRKEIDVLIGTASLATGTDGLDKVCDTLFIVDDTDDDSLRRQLIGRIMPRGASTNASAKQVYRLVRQ